MGDDPYLPDLSSAAISHGLGGAATGGSSFTVHQGLSPGAQLLVVVVSCLSLGLAIGAVLITAIGQRTTREQMADKIEAVERRWIDRVSIAEREARILRDEIDRMKVELKINTNH